MRLRALAPGKVNLSLFLGPVREDGRHELVTLLESVSLADEVTVQAAEHDQVVCPGVEGENIVSAALAALRAQRWAGPPVRVEVVKRVPVAAGMGGGSGDAAAMLRLAREMSPIADETIASLAVSLGADVPSQLSPGRWLGTGAGETIEPAPAVPEHALVIVPSAHALGTAEVYREADRLGLGRSADELAGIARGLRAGWRAEHLVNDLEPAARSLCPPIADALAAAREAGADAAFVSGSGPTVVGLFWGQDGRGRARKAVPALRRRYPGAAMAEPVLADFGAPAAA